jgi:ribose transport system permease protein
MVPERFPTLSNLEIVLEAAAVPLVFSLGVTIVMVMEDFDLSIGANASLMGMIAATLMAEQGVSTVFVLLIVAAISLLIGLVNGLVTTRLGVSAFIATLGMSTILAGLTFAINSGANVYEGLSGSFVQLSRMSSLGVNTAILIAGGFCGICWFVMAATRLGHNMYAIGSNPTAARYSGISVPLHRTIGFLIAAFSSGLAGILLTARSESAYIHAGETFLIPSYTAAFIGAATFTSGLFNVPGTLVGVLLVAILFNGMTMVGVEGYVQNIVTGTILIGAIALTVRQGRFQFLGGRR